MTRPVALLTFALGALACGEEPARVRIVGPDAEGYAPLDVALGTLSDLTTVSGTAARVLGGARFDLRYESWPPDRGLGRDGFVDGARPVSVAWATDGDVAVADDFDGLSMYSAYVHLEEASEHFGELGVACAGEEVTVYYHPRFDQRDTQNDIRSDNAAFIPELDALAFFPMRVLQDIPFSMNPGVVAHEYAHRVTYCELWGKRMFELFGRFGDVVGSQQTLNRLRATDEGMADFFGGAVSADPAFLRPSLSGALGEGRMLDAVRALDAGWLSGDEPRTQHNLYDPYAAGAVLASTLWSFAEIAGLGETERAVLAAQRRIGEQVADRFTYRFGELESAVIEALPTEHRAPLCARARQSYEVAWSLFGAVCP